MTDATNISVIADTAHVTAALCAVSKEETRYYLQGVFFDARGFIAATNGHIAFAARCNDASRLAGITPANVDHATPGVIVPTDALAAALKGKGNIVAISRDENGLWWLSCGALRLHFQPVDGPFPDWTRIIPHTPEKETAAHYQPQYIKALGDMAKALRDGKRDSANFFHIHQSGEGPALVTFPQADATDGANRTDCCAVLMPMRSKNSASFDTEGFLKA